MIEFSQLMIGEFPASNYRNLYYVGLAVATLSFFKLYLDKFYPTFGYIPTIGHSSRVLSYISALQIFEHGRQIIAEGYKKYPTGLFKIPTLLKWEFVVGGGQYVDDMRRAGEELSFHQGGVESIRFDYTIQSNIVNTGVKGDSLAWMDSDNLHDECVAALTDLVPTSGQEWTSIPLWKTLERLVARMGNRAFVGLPLCRNQDYLDLCIGFAANVMGAAIKINLAPKFLRPIVGPLLSPYQKHKELALKYLGPLFSERLRMKEEKAEMPDDLVTWLVEEAEGEDAKVENLGMRILFINFAAIHTTSMIMSHVLFDLAARPEYIEPLRQEAYQITESEGWSKSAIAKLYKLDSFIHEAVRYSSLSAISMMRKVCDPNGFKFSNGVVLPYGSSLSVISDAMHHDAAFYPDPNTFDGFRFYNLGKPDLDAGNENEFHVKHAFASLSTHWVLWGLGKHACPGRFFAAHELKATVAYILLNYDIGLEGNRRPDNQWIAHAIFVFCPNHHLRRTIMSYYQPAQERGYLPLGDHALIGNLRTAALVSLDGSVESYCVPHFDSPSVFARILDKDKGGHFSIQPTIPYTSKQNYLPSSNVLQTKFMNDAGVVSVTDFLPRPLKASVIGPAQKPLLPWLIRRVECVRGSLSINVECAPAFNYARNPHTTNIVDDESIPLTSTKQRKALFESADLTLDLRYVAETTAEDVDAPVVHLTTLDLSAKGHKGPAIQAFINLVEGQAVTFILRNPPGSTNAYATIASPSANRAQMQPSPEIAQNVVLPGAPGNGALVSTSQMPGRPLEDPFLTRARIFSKSLFTLCFTYWYDWIRNSTYTGSWKEAVHRSALALKLLIFEPTGPSTFLFSSSPPSPSSPSITPSIYPGHPLLIDNGAVVASPTFSLPEYIGGTRNWDYRYSWIRDSSFTLYALIRLGFTEEANAYLEFIFERLRHKNPDGSLQIMYTIHGEKEIPEVELTHMDGHKASKPVRIGNGAADHKQLDIYGELFILLTDNPPQFGKPLSYDDWVLVRGVVDYAVEHAKEPDLSIWEVRNRERNFTYSKIMLWVAIDRGLRLADKRSLPCPNRFKWLAARDELYEEIMHNAWDKDGKFFGQSYEDTNVLDSAVLIMPLVFFMQASDPRFVSTLKQILKTPDKGGLTSNNLVYRYDTRKTEDGVGGEEGTFCLCTLWCVEALTRAGETDRAFLPRAISMFEDFLLYLNHVGLCTEEISDSGEALGNAVQGFTHVTLISAAYNLSRTLSKKGLV
ncbi:hypothetical protein NP233_g3894 [Leucocoprinus birnbaumii]|uniref:Glycoside hydrolase family 15 protein n=1 Tax=Leucocoprinus birnbaumii TaxID=56174 RepID=A0AAD5VWF7_9AGAR|nr:hypothetical protein NP233_g3894 [Leucocoprinus birnbaumii]